MLREIFWNRTFLQMRLFLVHSSRRYYKKKSWKMQRRKASSLEKFQAFYSEEYGENWPSIFEALTVPTRHCAAVNKFATQTDVHNKLSLVDAQVMDIAPLNRSATEMHDSELKLVCYFPKAENIVRFPKQDQTSNRYFDYYLLDASSLLPVLVLDIYPGNCVLDMCASPGGKSVLVSQLLSKEGSLVASEVSNSRRANLVKVIKDYIPKISKTKHLVYIRSLCGSKFGELEPATYDRVLVDAPCSSDRHNLNTNFAFSLWSTELSKAKANAQRKLLASAMQTVVPGGIVVYSTCSLSPFENDGVVDEVLSQFSESDQLKVNVLDVDFASHSLAQMFNYRLTRFGTLILPSRTKNWGPMYICKLQRVASESETKSHEVKTDS